MLIKFDDIVRKYGKPIGVIHIGAHLMEERYDYLINGLYNTIWLEANTNIYNQIKIVESQPTNELVFNFAISDVDDKIYEFNITNNGQSSSILELDKHLIHHPTIYVSETMNIQSKRMDTLIREKNININNYDFLNIDIQGAELLALKGFGDLLYNIKYIYTEINKNYLYKDCALVDEIDEYLISYGFDRVETSMTEFEWGDALYVKKNL